MTLSHFLHHLRVLHDALGIEHEHRAGEDLELVDEHAEVAAERPVHVVTAAVHRLDVLGAAEAVHRKRQVEAHRQGVDLVAERRESLVEGLRLHLADGRVERRYDADDRRLAGDVGIGDVLHPVGAEGGQVERRRSGADLDLLAGEGERVALERDSAVTAHGRVSCGWGKMEDGSIAVMSPTASPPRCPCG